MCLSVREEKSAIRIDEWTKLFLETIVYNLIEDFSRNFYPIVHNWKEKKNISLMHVPSTSYQLEKRELLNLGVNQKREMFRET